MKNTIILLTLVLTSFGLHAQDTIHKTDGSVIIGLVKEITEESIIYTRTDQTDGPIRKIPISHVSEIVYKDGTTDRFYVKTIQQASEQESPVNEHTPGTINNTNETVIIHRRGPDIRVRPGQKFPDWDETNDPLLKNGVYLEALFGYVLSSQRIDDAYDYYSSYTSPTYLKYDNIALGLRFGSKLYFGSNEKNKFGLNVAWISLTGLMNNANRGNFIFAPVNFGLVSVFKLTDHIGIEANTSTGFVLSSLYYNTIGLNYGVDVKFRYDGFAFGLDLARTNAIFGSPSEFANLFRISIGYKF